MLRPVCRTPRSYFNATANADFLRNRVFFLRNLKNIFLFFWVFLNYFFLGGFWFFVFVFGFLWEILVGVLGLLLVCPHTHTTLLPVHSARNMF